MQHIIISDIMKREKKAQQRAFVAIVTCAEIHLKQGTSLNSWIQYRMEVKILDMF